jgi:GTP-binding protein
MLPVVAIVGRPNVGKSTLFNRLTRTRAALVDDRPGVTRDRHYGVASDGALEIILIDTGGFELNPDDSLFSSVRVQAEAAIQEADLILFVVDQKAGRTPTDDQTASVLRKAASRNSKNPPVLLIVNKCDNDKAEIHAADFWGLGLDNMLCISAEHGRGSFDLWSLIGENLANTMATEAEEEDENEIRIAVLGRPNIGKSTLINRLVGEERHVVHDAPGTTMDSIDSVVEIDGQTYRFIDTAGVRRRAKIDDRLEIFAATRAIRCIERCHIILLVVDATEPVSHQDARLAALIEDRGRGVLILFNKWDKVAPDPERNVRVVDDERDQRLPHLKWARALYISALTGKGCRLIIPETTKIYAEFNKRIKTAELNNFLEAAIDANSVPQHHHRPVKLNYMTQTRVRPPTFAVWANTPDGVPEAYRRYLENRLRSTYGFGGTPIRVQFRQKRRIGQDPGQ